MNAPTRIQLINGPDGQLAHVVISYQDHIARYAGSKDLVPHAVASRVLVDDVPPVRAWREHLGLTQAEVAERLGITQPAYARQEARARIRKASRERIAAALGINAVQLDM